MPNLVAVQVETIDAGFAEEDVEVLAVAGDGARAITVLGVVAADVGRFGEGGLEVFCPKDVALGPIDANDMAQELIHAVVALLKPEAGIAGQVNTLADDNGAGSAGAGQLGAPNDVLSA